MRITCLFGIVYRDFPSRLRFHKFQYCSIFKVLWSLPVSRTAHLLYQVKFFLSSTFLIFFEFLFSGNSVPPVPQKCQSNGFFCGAAREMSFSAARCLARQLIYNTTLSAKVNPFFQFFSTYFSPSASGGRRFGGAQDVGALKARRKNGALCLSPRHTSCALLYK